MYKHILNYDKSNLQLKKVCREEEKKREDRMGYLCT